MSATPPHERLRLMALGIERGEIRVNASVARKLRDLADEVERLWSKDQARLYGKIDEQSPYIPGPE